MRDLDFKAILAVLTVAASFALFAVDLILKGGGQVDATVAGFTSGGLMLVLGFYFGTHNGALAANADMSARLSQQAHTELSLSQQRRYRDPGSPQSDEAVIKSSRE